MDNSKTSDAEFLKITWELHTDSDAWFLPDANKEEEQMNSLPLFTVYKNPLDYPGKIVVRRWDVVKGSTAPAPEPLCIVDTIEQARDVILEHYPGGYRLDRVELDDPCIVETWI